MRIIVMGSRPENRSKEVLRHQSGPMEDIFLGMTHVQVFGYQHLGEGLGERWRKAIRRMVYDT
jgi:hypothetical protein